MAQQFWPGEDPLGKRLTLTFSPDAVREVVGVVGDVKIDSLDQSRPGAMLYSPLDQMSVPSNGGWGSFPMSLVVRSSSGSAGMVSAVSNAVHEVDRDIPLRDVFSMDELVANSVSQQRFSMLLLGAFAGLALFLGARLSEVLRTVVYEGMKPTLIGVGVGTVGALALGRVLSSMIYGVKAADPVTFLAVALLLATVALLASIVPAYRATKVDPMVALRYE
jgi:putative ABC transport system permease protein